MSKCYAVVYEYEKKFYVAFEIGAEPICPGRKCDVFSGDSDTVLTSAQKLAEKLNKPLRDAEKQERRKEKRRMAKTQRYPHRISKKDAAGLAKFIGLL